MSDLSPQRNAATSTLRRDVRAIVALTESETSTFLAGENGERLRTLLPQAHWFEPTRSSNDAWLALLRDVRPEVIVSAWRTPSLPADLDGLRYVCHLVGSLRKLVPRPLLAAGLKATNWGGIAAPIVAEHALLLLLAALRGLPAWGDYVTGTATHEDKNRLRTRTLHGRRVAVHGFGQVARELIRLIRPFNVDVSAYSAGVPRDLMRSHGVRPVESLEALADDADVFVTCEALTDASRRSIDRDVLGRLRRGGVFVNVGRGEVVDEIALAEVAAERGLRLACDVFVREPLPDDSPLLAVPGALYSPHIAGPTLDAYPQCGASAVANVERYLHGDALENVVSLEQYDRTT